jgi:hypothetical protein
METWTIRNCSFGASVCHAGAKIRELQRRFVAAFGARAMRAKPYA